MVIFVFLFGRRAGDFTGMDFIRARDIITAWGTSQGPGGLHKDLWEFHKVLGDFTRGPEEFHKGVHVVEVGEEEIFRAPSPGWEGKRRSELKYGGPN